MAEKTPTQQLAEKLLYTPAYAADKSANVKRQPPILQRATASSSITARPSARWPLRASRC